MDKPACTTPAQSNSPVTPIPVGWARSAAPTGYLEAVAAMEGHVAAMAEGKASELIWLTEHPPLYSAGTSARPTDLITPDRFPVFQTGRGGQYTYHGPKQRVVYVMLDVRRRAGDVRAFVLALEQWTIAALARVGVRGETRCGRVGVWVSRTNLNDGQEDKVAAIGIRLRRWISFHGIAINVDPDLTHFDGIVPCGIREHGVTSLTQLTGRDGDVLADELDQALRATFEERFGPLVEAPAPI